MVVVLKVEGYGTRQGVEYFEMKDGQECSVSEFSMICSLSS